MAQTRKLNPSKEAWTPGAAKTCTASGAITGSRFVKVVTGGTPSQPMVAQCTTSGEKVFGIAEYDVASGGDVSVLRIGAYGVTVGAANLTGGNEVQTDAAGKAIVLASGRSAGTVLHDAVAAAVGYVALTV